MISPHAAQWVPLPCPAHTFPDLLARQLARLDHHSDPSANAERVHGTSPAVVKSTDRSSRERCSHRTPTATRQGANSSASRQRSRWGGPRWPPRDRCRPSSASRRDSADRRRRRLAARPRQRATSSALQLQLQRRRVLLEAIDALGAGDGDDVAALREQPGQHQLRRRAALLRARASSAAPAGCSARGSRPWKRGWASRAGRPREYLDASGSAPSAGCGRAASRRRSEMPSSRAWAAWPPPARDRAASTRSAARRWDAPRARGAPSPAPPRTARDTRTLPCSTRRFMPPTVSSIGTLGVDPVLVVEVDHVHPEALEAGLAGLRHVLRRGR